jgi:chitin disaccharide deacetylase
MRAQRVSSGEFWEVRVKPGQSADLSSRERSADLSSRRRSADLSSRRREAPVGISLTRRDFLAAGAALAAAGVAGCSTLLGGRARVATRESLAEWLGHPASTPLLIIHADDVGIARSANAATIQAFDRGIIDSCSVMVPCPDAPLFAEWARAHRRADVGVHFTLTSQPGKRWGPVAGAARVPTLVDSDGMLPVRLERDHRIDTGELEVELRAQVARARELGFDLTHLDGHQHIVQLRSAEVFGVLLRIARDERLPFRFPRAWLKQARWGEQSFGTATVPLERMITISPKSATADQWTEWYVAQVRTIPAGLNELFVHLGIESDELRAVVPDSANWGSAWRARDLAAMGSPAFADAVRSSGATRIGWREVRDYLRA